MSSSDFQVEYLQRLSQGGVLFEWWLLAIDEYPPFRLDQGPRELSDSESLQIRLLDLARPLGEAFDILVGGVDTPCTTTVPFAVTCPGTLAADTGGHLAEVERFAVTEVRC
ncbi:hypothetical protein [Nocardia anaemiae]|uniref:hypothetical protein n=1 Tax=Nocardia anaemiae TaxID=263910 RepID=UPI0007A40E83|nr:hypothetical protein [Nocardia anaemiae]